MQWLWRILLNDGTRALSQTGSWSRALQHAQRHNAIGQCLLDGRQVAILAHSAFDASDRALLLLEDTQAPSPWEQAVVATLRVLCLSRAEQDPSPAIGQMMERYLRAEESIGEHPVFHIRLGLCVIDLAISYPGLHRITDTVVRAALDTEDAFIAHDVLTHRNCRAQLDTTVAARLRARIDAASLGKGDMPAQARHDLLEFVRISERALESALGRSWLRHPHGQGADSASRTATQVETTGRNQ